MKTFLITGGAGYIGSLTAQTLNDLGFKTIVVDDLSLSLQSLVDPRSIFYHANILNADTLDTIFSMHKIDAVFHLAAKANVFESVQNPELYHEVNVEGTRQLLAAMKKAAVGDLIFASSGAVFGKQILSSYNEDDVPSAVSPYGESKIQAENLVREWVTNGRGRRSVVLRYFNVAGSDLVRNYGQFFGNGRLLSRLCVAATQKQPLTVHCGQSLMKDGSAIRDYIHVSDVVRMNILALDWFGKQNYDVFHVGTGQAHSVLEMVELFQRENRVSFPIQKELSRAGDASLSVANNCKINKLLGSKFSYLKSSEICRSSYVWFLKHATHIPSETAVLNK